MAPSASPGDRTRLLTGLGAGAAVLGGLAFVGFGDPHSADFPFPPCPFLELTGLFCPACGGMRMTHDLLHGDVAAAVADNAVALVGLPLLVMWVLTRRFTSKPVLTTSFYATVLAIALMWTVVRNLPGFPLVPTVLDG